MLKVSRKYQDVTVTFTDDMEQTKTASAHCKDCESAKELVKMVREAIKQDYGFAKCRAILEGDTI